MQSKQRCGTQGDHVDWVQMGWRLWLCSAPGGRVLLAVKHLDRWDGAGVKEEGARLQAQKSGDQVGESTGASAGLPEGHFSLCATPRPPALFLIQEWSLLFREWFSQMENVLGASVSPH